MVLFSYGGACRLDAEPLNMTHPISAVPMLPAVAGPTRRAALLALLACACTHAQSQAEMAPALLRVTALPDESPAELLRRFAPLGRYLEAALGVRMEWTPLPDQSAVVDALVSRKVDVAWLGGFQGVQANVRSGGQVLPLVQREADEAGRSVFVTRVGSGIRRLSDLKDRLFSFGSATSPSGHLMPRSALLAARIDPRTDFKRLAYSGPPEATVAAVLSGKVDAGALSLSAWDKLVAEQKVDAQIVRVFATTEPYHDLHWAVHAEVPPDLRARLNAAFLALDPTTPAGQDILTLQRTTRFVPALLEHYADLRAAAEQAGLLR
jgi:phosphonate transport system substrate-binding protein